MNGPGQQKSMARPDSLDVGRAAIMAAKQVPMGSAGYQAMTQYGDVTVRGTPGETHSYDAVADAFGLPRPEKPIRLSSEYLPQ